MVISIGSHQHYQEIVFTALLKSRFKQPLISLLGDQHKGQIFLQKGSRVTLHPTFYFLRKQKRKLCDEVVKPVTYFFVLTYSHRLVKKQLSPINFWYLEFKCQHHMIKVGL